MKPGVFFDVEFNLLNTCQKDIFFPLLFATEDFAMRFMYTALAITLVLSSLASVPAIAAGGERSHVSGKFALDLNGTKEGVVKPIEGNQIAPEVMAERLAPELRKKPSVRPQTTIRPSTAVGAIQPLCPKPPCYLQNMKKKID